MASLVKKVDEQIAKNEDKSLSGFVVVLTEDSDATASELEKLAKDNDVSKVPLTVFEGAAGPPKYNIAKDADVTVMMWVGLEVKVNHAFGPGEFDDKAADKVASDISKILKDGAAPKKAAKSKKKKEAPKED